MLRKNKLNEKTKYKSIKTFLKKTPLYSVIQTYYLGKEIFLWLIKGKPVPPPQIVKMWTIKKYAKRFGISTLVETGTYLGDLLWYTRHFFKQAYSIELDSKLAKQCRVRLAQYPNIHIFKGDSSKILKKILPLIKKPAVFWLDAHYSGGITAKGKTETPILDELKYISSRSTLLHIILIDDARCFNGTRDYPTIKVLKATVIRLFPNYSFNIKNDIIRIVPKFISKS